MEAAQRPCRKESRAAELIEARCKKMQTEHKKGHLFIICYKSSYDMDESFLPP